MNRALHITSGDIAGFNLSKSGVPGEVLVWHDILYDGPRKTGWPGVETLSARARFLSDSTGGGLEYPYVLKTLQAQYERLRAIEENEPIILWFDACLFDQSMLCHILNCLAVLGIETGELLCVDAFPGIDPYHGLGQLTPEQLTSVYDHRRWVTADQFSFAKRVDNAFAHQAHAEFLALVKMIDPPLPWIPAAVKRWLMEQPDPDTGLGRLEQLALDAIRSGIRRPGRVFDAVAKKETPPQYWGDITLWQKINSLADRTPCLIRIEGPMAQLPQWEGIADLTQFRLYPV